MWTVPPAEGDSTSRFSARVMHVSFLGSLIWLLKNSNYLGVLITPLGDGHGGGFADATVGSGYHKDSSSHGHLQVLLHKPLGGGQEGIPSGQEQQFN